MRGCPRPASCRRLSIASENSLPNAPKSDTAIASTPAKGPRPTTLIQTSAQISVSTPRIESRKRRTGNRKISDGTMLRAASRLTGSANSAPQASCPAARSTAFRRARPDRPAARSPGSGGIIIIVIQPSWLQACKQPRRRKVEIDQAEHENRRPQQGSWPASPGARKPAGRKPRDIATGDAARSGVGKRLMRAHPCRTAGHAPSRCRYRSQTR